MRFGLALAQYDYSVAGEWPLCWQTVLEHASHAEALGVDSLWLSDHLFLDLAKYGGPSTPAGAFEPLVTISALARRVPRVRLGTLVLCEALRPAAVLAKVLASVDLLSGGRLDVGVGAGWYEPEYDAIGLPFPAPAERLARLREAIEIVRGMLAPGGGPVTVHGRFHRAAGAVNRPAACQDPRPPVIVGGKGDRLLRLVAELADGWNTCWVWTPELYRGRLRVLEAECERVGRDPGSVSRSLGLYALCGESERDLARRFERLRAATPAGILDGVTLDEWRVGRLVGTVEQVRDQASSWAGFGVETIVLGVGAVPFQIGDLDDVAPLAEALHGV